MIAESHLTENMTAFVFYLAVAFFLAGLFLGWILWGAGGSRGTRSSGPIGDPNIRSNIKPLLNPAGISRAVITRQPPTEQRKTAAAPAAPPTRVERDKPAPAQTPKAEMAAAWQGLDEDVSAGRASLDSTLGLVYSEAPEQADDLQAIKGVGKVLNDKLNDFGIYTYRQIAGWDDSIVAEFSTRLSFKDRVKRDDWVGQAKALHKEKYAEELG